jgi:hypothetical protein
MMEMNESIVAIQISYCSFFFTEFPQDVFSVASEGSFSPEKKATKRTAT